MATDLRNYQTWLQVVESSTDADVNVYQVWLQVAHKDFDPVRHTTDALLKGTRTVSHGTDALLKETRSASHGTDALLESSASLTDLRNYQTWLQVAESPTDADLNVYQVWLQVAHEAPRPVSHTTDALLAFAGEKQGHIGNGIKVLYSLTTSPISWVQIGALIAVSPVWLAVDKLERTPHGTSPFRRMARGKIEVSALRVEILQDLDAATSPQQVELLNLLTTHPTIQWRIEIPIDQPATRFRPLEFRGYVATWQIATPVEDKQVLIVGIVFDGSDVTLLDAGPSVV